MSSKIKTQKTEDIFVVKVNALANTGSTAGQPFYDAVNKKYRILPGQLGVLIDDKDNPNVDQTYLQSAAATFAAAKNIKFVLGMPDSVNTKPLRGFGFELPYRASHVVRGTNPIQVTSTLAKNPMLSAGVIAAVNVQSNLVYKTSFQVTSPEIRRTFGEENARIINPSITTPDFTVLATPDSTAYFYTSFATEINKNSILTRTDYRGTGGYPLVALVIGAGAATQTVGGQVINTPTVAQVIAGTLSVACDLTQLCFQATFDGSAGASYHYIDVTEDLRESLQALVTAGVILTTDRIKVADPSTAGVAGTGISKIVFVGLQESGYLVTDETVSVRRSNVTVHNDPIADMNTQPGVLNFRRVVPAYEGQNQGDQWLIIYKRHNKQGYFNQTSFGNNYSFIDKKDTLMVDPTLDYNVLTIECESEESEDFNHQGGYTNSWYHLIHILVPVLPVDTCTGSTAIAGSGTINATLQSELRALLGNGSTGWFNTIPAQNRFPAAITVL